MVALNRFALVLACVMICGLSADFLIRRSDHALHICRECAEICTQCADACDRLGGGAMARCAATCRECAATCDRMTTANA